MQILPHFKTEILMFILKFATFLPHHIIFELICLNCEYIFDAEENLKIKQISRKHKTPNYYHYHHHLYGLTQTGFFLIKKRKNETMKSLFSVFLAFLFFLGFFGHF